MFVGGVCFFVVLVGTLFFSRERDEVKMPVVEVMVPAERGAPIFVDRIGAWVVFAVVLIALSYGPYLIGYLADPAFVARGLRAW